MLRASRHGEIVRIRVARTFFGRALYEVSCYLFGDTLVDSGCPAAAREMVTFLRSRGVRRVVHTHHHEDHTGGDDVVHKQLGAEIVAPVGTVSFLRRPYRLPFYRRLVWGQPRPAPARPFRDGEEVVIGGKRFLAVHTPGHAPDHHCLFDPDGGLLFSGDLFISSRSVYIRGVEEAHLMLRSLRRVAALEPRLMLCAHAGIVRNPVAALERKIEFWERLAAEAERRVDQGATVSAVSRHLLGGEGTMYWVSLGGFAKRHLIRSLLRGRRGLFSEGEENDDATVRSARG